MTNIYIFTVTALIAVAAIFWPATGRIQQLVKVVLTVIAIFGFAVIYDGQLVDIGG